MTHHTVAVIGHVDHGKTALVRALTGIETDRLQEEQDRGMSIVLGFAWRDYASGGVDFVDAPGHADLIRTMTAGASGADAVLLAVSATEGVGRQTLEHLQIAALLGIEAGVVALTKTDLCDADGVAARIAEVRDALAGTALTACPIIACSARTGAGVDAVHEALAALPDRRSPAPAAAFLPIDRVFSVRGAGTVVTGTLLGGPLSVGDPMTLQPAGTRVTIRGLQARGQDAETIEPGRRAAVNLRAVDVGDIAIGEALCAPGGFEASRRLDVGLRLTGAGGRALKHLEAVRVLFGARSAVASVRLFDGQALNPGESGWAQLRFESDIIAFAGQPAVIRRLSPPETVGGAVILDPAPPMSRRRDPGRIAVLRAAETGDAAAVRRALAAQNGGLLTVADAARLSRRPAREMRNSLAEDHVPIDDQHLAELAALSGAEQAYLSALAAAHEAAPTRAAWPLAGIRRTVLRAFAPAIVEYVEKRLSDAGLVMILKGRVALANHDPIAALTGDQRARLETIEARLLAGGATPPDPGELRESADLLELLVASGRVVALENHALRRTLYFHAAAVAAAFGSLAAAYADRAAFTTGEARMALATSRKFIVPLLEHFDTLGWTLRDGDVRRIARGE